jgi:hypothetical protein
MDHFMEACDPPNSIVWRERDGTDELVVTYTLEDVANGTRLTQPSDATLGAPRMLFPLMRHGISHDIDRQLKTLRRSIEQQSP